MRAVSANLARGKKSALEAVFELVGIICRTYIVVSLPSVFEPKFCMNRSCRAIRSVERISDASISAYDAFFSPSEAMI